MHRRLHHLAVKMNSRATEVEYLTSGIGYSPADFSAVYSGLHTFENKKFYLKKVNLDCWEGFVFVLNPYKMQRK